jgi:YidC/Oxa1 family membrane protein insertase
MSILSELFQSIATLMGVTLNGIYNYTGFNYGVAIILFTILIKILLIPLSVKQYKSTLKMQEVQPIVAEIQRKYKDDAEKLNQELSKVYLENKVNPFGGCATLLIQIPILWALFLVIQQPLTYMLQIPRTDITAATAIVNETTTYKEGSVIRQTSINNNDTPEQKTHAYTLRNKISQKSDTFKKLFEKGNLLNFIFPFSGFGIDLAQSPQLNRLNLLWFIPILAGYTTYLSSKVSMAQTTGAQGSAMQTNMMIVFPLMAGYFTFLVPAGMGLYWLISNVVQILQQIIMNKQFNKKEVTVK